MIQLQKLLKKQQSAISIFSKRPKFLRGSSRELLYEEFLFYNEAKSELSILKILDYILKLHNLSITYGIIKILDRIFEYMKFKAGR